MALSTSVHAALGWATALVASEATSLEAGHRAHQPAA
jgi:hypothetical protein